MNIQTNPKRTTLCFAAVSGIILMTGNMITLIIPLRMSDLGLDYAQAGSMLASFSLGLVLIKLLTGYIADSIGIKPCILFSIILSVASLLGLCLASTLLLYRILFLLFGISRGLFTAVNTAYIFSIDTQDGQGRRYGNIMGISSFLTALGGMLAAALYPYGQGRHVFLLAALLQLLAFALMSLLPDSPKAAARSLSSKTFPLGPFHLLPHIFSHLHPKLLLLALAVMWQTALTGPLWNLVFPMYFYRNFTASVLTLGIFMSVDELSGGPIYALGGHICDYLGAARMAVLSFLLAALASLLMPFMPHALLFGLAFLLCSIFVTGTYIALPVLESAYAGKEQRSLDFALISFLAALGDMGGNYLAGKLTQSLGLLGWIAAFALSYLVLAGLIHRFFEVEKTPPTQAGTI